MMATLAPKRFVACCECSKSFPVYRERGDTTRCMPCKDAARIKAYRASHPTLRANEYAKWKASATEEQIEAKRNRNRARHAADPQRSTTAMREWREKNRDKYRSQHRAYYAKHREAMIQKVIDRKASYRVPPWADKAEIAKVYRVARRLTEVTGIRHHVDHVVPLRGRVVSGLHVQTNLRVIAAEDNWRKQARFEV